MDNKIKQNLVYLANNLTNLDSILLYLQQNDVFSLNESDETRTEDTPFNQNVKLLNILQRKDFPINVFLEILRNTQNGHCADKIEGISPGTNRKLEKPKILGNLWWPDKKFLIKSLHRRKIGDKFLIEELHERIAKDEKRMLVICESVDASKLTALGGVGKTLTATWYGNHYEEEYDHVIWIDCGEDSLLVSFKSLARDLKVDDRKELSTVEEFSRKCYEALKEFKCLWIFDNAESYKGEDGIKEVLPKFKENFYCVITSRSLDWGAPNIGHGDISRLELSIFGELESLEFLKAHLQQEVQHTEQQLKELSGLLGNLPLALQLAIAALNMRKIDLQNYIEETSLIDLRNIVDTKFDDYEKTINGNIKISLGLIEKEPNGKIANDILNILGYIRPDNIQAKFLLKIMKVELITLKGAIDLLEKYSLVNKSGAVQETPYNKGIKNKILGKSRIKIEMDLLSIHRLLQQVIRHNCRTSENETIKKILGCKGFLDYKLLPFSKYASDELRKEFPKVRAQLLDQEELKKLLKEKRFEESVEFARFIDKELNTNTTKFNLAICLERSEQLEEAANILKRLFGKHKTENDVTIAAEILLSCKELPIKAVECGKILDLSEEPTRSQIGSFLFHFYFLLDRIEDALKENVYGVLKYISSSYTLIYLLQEERFGESVLLSRYIDQEIKTNTSKFNYAICLEKNKQLEENVKVLEGLYKKKMIEEMEYVSVDMGLLKLEKQVSKCLVGGHLLVSHWKMDNNSERLREILEERKSFMVIQSQGKMTTLLRILNSNLIQSNYTLTNDGSKLKAILEGDSNKIELNSCFVDFSLPLPNDLQELVLREAQVKDAGDSNLVDISEWLPKKLSTLKIIFYEEKQVVLSLKSISSIENINLSNCSLSLDSGNRISPTELTLSNISIVKSGKELLNTNINEFIDFHNMSRLELTCYSVKKNLSIDLSEEESVTMEYLRLIGVNIVNLKSADGNNGRVNITEARIETCSLDLSVLPPSLEKLSLLFLSEVFVSGGIDLPNLKYLELDDMSQMSHFRTLELTHLYLNRMKEVNVDFLPRIKTNVVRIDKKYRIGTRIVGGVIQLDKLILSGFHINEVQETLPHFNLKQLVLHSDSYNPVVLILLVHKEIPIIAVGRVDWSCDNFKNSPFSKQVDRKSEFYLFHEGTGKAIEWKDFDELCDFG